MLFTMTGKPTWNFISA